MPNEMAHVKKFVLISNEDKRFKDFAPGSPARDPQKKGKDFWSARGPDGNVNAFGFKSGMDTCTDGAPDHGGVVGDPNRDPNWQSSTSYTQGGQSFNGRTDPYVVLPQTQTGTNKKGQPTYSSPVNVPGNPFHDMGLKAGDCVRVTDPKTGKSVYAVYAENGPAGQLGENSYAVNQALGEQGYQKVDPKTGLIARGKNAKALNTQPMPGVNATGFPMTDDHYLQNEFYPGSANRNADGSLKKMTFDEVQKHCAAKSADATPRGGVPIITGKNDVLVSIDLQPAAFADPLSMHMGDCPMLTGSDSVSLGLRPATRVGDDCTCGMNVVDGESSVLVFGCKTTASVPELPFGDPSLVHMPAWAAGATNPLGAGPPLPGLGAAKK